MAEVARRGILRGSIIALLATVGMFTVESIQLSGAQESEGVIVDFRRKPYAVRQGDTFEMVIEYTTPTGPRTFLKSRTVWDIWGPMAQLGTRLPVLYKDDGRAWVDRFFYARPGTGVLLVFDALLGLSWLWITTIGRERFSKMIAQQALRRAERSR